MGAACPSRKQETSTTQGNAGKVPCSAANLPSTKEPVVKVACSSPTPLPTKSWRALLEDASLNADAKPFTPPPGLQKLPNAQKQDAAKDTKFKYGAGAQNQNGPCHAPAAAETLAPTAHGLASAGCGGVVIPTHTYLQLLKEGGTKKKAPPAARGRETRQDAAKQASVTALAKACPMTVSGLKQTWQTALKGQECSGEYREQAAKNKVVHDDIDAEKMNDDQDLSDPVYWSETECADRKFLRSNASAHRLGRRQACARVCSYVMQDLSYDLDKAVGKMLSRLNMLGEHQRVIHPETSSQRRLVIGLKEVARRVRQSKVSCLVVAPDLESDTTEGGLDDRVREVLAMCYKKDIPVIFALSRAGLGQALGKTMVVSLLGVLDTQGAQDLFKDAVQLARGARQTWLARLPDKQ